MNSKKIVIIGGVAGGASAAARARRISESAEITLFERGPHVSFANCGLPYFIGGEIAKSESLLLESPEVLSKRLHININILTEVISIDREARTVTARDRLTGGITHTPYDALLLSPGAKPVKPPIPGINLPGHFTLRNVPETIAVSEWIDTYSAKRAVVVGGGYIGLEMAEQLVRRGLNVTIVEAAPQVMGVVDYEMAGYLHRSLLAHGVAVHLNDSVVCFEEPDQTSDVMASVVVLKSGDRLPADVVVLGIGVRPESSLAKEAGLEIGSLGGIRVDSHLRTSDPHIWAVGDAIEVKNGVTGEWQLIPLAGPANRQGRIAADNMLGANRTYSGTLGTGILRLFDLTVACTGATERSLLRLGIPHETVHLHPNSHAGYYPGAKALAIKILFKAVTGELLGAQIVGQDGVDKRIDVLAAALRAGLTVHDVADMELAYAPPFGSAKDPVNIAGMIAENILDGYIDTVQWHEIAGLDLEKTILLDVRQPGELEEGKIPGSVNIPLSELRDRLSDIPRDKQIVAYCRSGQRSYSACRILMQHGFDCKNLSGAFLTWSAASDSF